MQLFDAALGELGVVAGLIVGDFNVEPTKIPCLAKGISAGLWVDLDAAWASARELSPLPLRSVRGIPLVVIGGILWLVVLLLPLLFLPEGLNLEGGLHLIWLSGRTLTVVGGLVRSLCLFSALLCGLLLGCLLWIRVGVLSRRRGAEGLGDLR